jgi:hypothetical protein
MAAGDFTLKGAKEMERKLRRMADTTPDHVAGGLRLQAEYTMTRVKRDRVPVDLGPLRASGHVKDPVRSGKDIEVTLGFGGPAGAGNLGETNTEEVGYALIQHEGIDFHHPGVGEAKYLEKQMNEDIPGMAERIGAEVERRLEREAARG